MFHEPIKFNVKYVNSQTFDGEDELHVSLGMVYPVSTVRIAEVRLAAHPARASGGGRRDRLLRGCHLRDGVREARATP